MVARGVDGMCSGVGTSFYSMRGNNMDFNVVFAMKSSHNRAIRALTRAIENIELNKYITSSEIKLSCLDGGIASVDTVVREDGVESRKQEYTPEIKHDTLIDRFEDLLRQINNVKWSGSVGFTLLSYFGAVEKIRQSWSHETRL